MKSWLSWNLIFRSGWPSDSQRPHASAFRVLGFKDDFDAVGVWCSLHIRGLCLLLISPSGLACGFPFRDFKQDAYFSSEPAVTSAVPSLDGTLSTGLLQACDRLLSPFH